MTMAILKIQDVLVSRIPLWTYCNCNDFERYETLPKFRHITDNTTKSNPENVINKLFRIRPLLELIRSNCIKIESEHCHSIDKQIIPVKTKCSEVVKQYNPKKAHKWGVQKHDQSWPFWYDLWLFHVWW